MNENVVRLFISIVLVVVSLAEVEGSSTPVKESGSSIVGD
jgi:hypothetical protein